jgi:hypothetical protein
MKVLAQKCQHCVQALWIREGFTTWFFIKAHAIIRCCHILATWNLVQSTMLLGLIGSGVDVILWPWVLASRQFGTADGCTLKCGRCPEARATMIDHFYYPIQEQFLLYIAEQIKVQPWWPECSLSYRNWEGADEVSLNKSKKHTCVSMCFQGTCSEVLKLFVIDKWFLLLMAVLPLSKATLSLLVVSYLKSCALLKVWRKVQILFGNHSSKMWFWKIAAIFASFLH